MFLSVCFPAVNKHSIRPYLWYFLNDLSFTLLLLLSTVLPLAFSGYRLKFASNIGESVQHSTFWTWLFWGKPLDKLFLSSLGFLMGLLKVAFFQIVQFVLQISKSPKRKYSKSLSWAWNLNKLFTVMGGNFKFHVQDSDLE